MKLLKSNYILFIIIAAVIYIISLLINNFIGYNFNNNSIAFNSIFTFFTLLGLLLLIIHNIVFKKQKEQLGFVFLFTLTLKVAIAYFFISSITETFQKYYAFVYFFVFLIIDVVFVVQLLNKKDSNN